MLKISLWLFTKQPLPSPPWLRLPGALKAIDADLHSSLTYRIRADDSDPDVLQLFHVDPVSGDLSMLKVLDFEALADPEPTYTFTVEAVDEEGVMPPGLTSVTVTIKVGVWKQFLMFFSFYHLLCFFFLLFLCKKKICISPKNSILAPCSQSTAGKEFAFASFACTQKHQW